jgi:hypothetical protein
MKQGSLVGYFGKLPKGRPPKDNKCRPNKKNQPTSVAAKPPVATKPAKKKRGSYTKWADPHNREALRAAMKDPTEESILFLDAKASKKHQAEPPATTKPAKKKRGLYMKRADLHNGANPTELSIFIPESTIHSIKQGQLEAQKKDSTINVLKTSEQRRPSLTTDKYRAWLEDTAQFRDKNSNGITREELIQVLMELSGAKDAKQAANHLDYLIQNKLLSNLNRNGRVISAQKTTIERSQITIDQQLRWHNVGASAWEEQYALNQPSEECQKLRAHFTINLDKTSVLANDGNIRVIESTERKKHEKNMND